MDDRTLEMRAQIIKLRVMMLDLAAHVYRMGGVAPDDLRAEAGQHVLEARRLIQGEGPPEMVKKVMEAMSRQITDLYDGVATAMESQTRIAAEDARDIEV